MPHIMHKGSQKWIIYIFVCSILLYDAFLYNNEVTAIQFGNITFANNRNHIKKTCEELVSEQKSNLNDAILQLSNICNQTVPSQYVIMKKIALTLVASIIIIMFAICMYAKDGDLIDVRSKRLLRSIPLLLVAGGILYFAYG